MSENEQSTRPPVVTPARVIAAICVVAPFIAVLYVTIYDRQKPEVAGFPFFFWWQLLWVAITAGLMGLAYYVVRREELARKAATAAVESADITTSESTAGTASTESTESSTDEEEGDSQ